MIAFLKFDLNIEFINLAEKNITTKKFVADGTNNYLAEFRKNPK